MAVVDGRVFFLGEAALPKMDILYVIGPRKNTLPSTTAILHVLLIQITICQSFNVDFSNEASY
jgi:hypothetical protein